MLSKTQAVINDGNRCYPTPISNMSVMPAYHEDQVRRGEFFLPPRMRTVACDFDCYECRNVIHIDGLHEALLPIYNRFVFTPRTRNIYGGYAASEQLEIEGGFMLVHWGGVNGEKWGPSISATGVLAPVAAKLIREAGITHYANRIDVCHDFVGNFEVARDRFTKVCNERNRESGPKGSSDDSVIQNGRGIKLIVPEGAEYDAVLYEKGVQLGDGYPQNWLRLEQRFFPHRKEKKLEFSTMSGEEMIGCRPISRELSAIVAEVAIGPYKMTKFPRTKGQNTRAAFCRQWGPYLDNMLDDLGSPCAVGCQLFEDIAAYRVH